MKKSKKVAVSLASAAIGVAGLLTVAAPANATPPPSPVVLGGATYCPVGTGRVSVYLEQYATGTHTPVQAGFATLNQVFHYSYTFTTVPNSGAKGDAYVTCYSPVGTFVSEYHDTNVTIDHPVVGDGYTQNLAPYNIVL
jgi:hypothetical protein